MPSLRLAGLLGGLFAPAIAKPESKPETDKQAAGKQMVSEQVVSEQVVGRQPVSVGSCLGFASSAS